jgi:hypothetical protein
VDQHPAADSNRRVKSVGASSLVPTPVVVGAAVVFALAGGYLRRLLDLYQALQRNVTSPLMSTQPLLPLDSGCDYAGIPCKYVWGHRLLVPTLLRWIHEWTGVSYDMVFYAFYLATLAGGYLVFYWFLRHWLEEVPSFLGMAYLAAVYPLTQTNPDPAQMMVGLMLYSVALVAIEADALWVVMLVTFVGIFNREEIGGVLVLYALRWLGLKPAMRYVASCVAILAGWGLAFWGARYVLGVPAGYVAGWAVGNVTTNVHGLIDAFRNLTPFHHFRIMFYLAVPPLLVPLVYRRWSAVPVLFRRAIFFVPAYVGILFVFSVLNETKQFMPLMAVVIPIGLSALFSPMDRRPAASLP